LLTAAALLRALLRLGLRPLDLGLRLELRPLK
jgi:hypothetical protein